MTMATDKQITKKYYNITETIELLGITRPTAYSYIKRGLLEGHKTADIKTAPLLITGQSLRLAKKIKGMYGKIDELSYVKLTGAMPKASNNAK